MKYSMINNDYGSYVLVPEQENECKFDSIIDVMKEARIFRIIKQDEKFIFEEQCDKYFCLELTKEQVLALANELIKICE